MTPARFATSDGAHIAYAGRIVATIDPQRAAAALCALHGISAALALAIAAGALSWTPDAMELARARGLIR